MVCGWQLNPNFCVRPAAAKVFYLRLTVEKIRQFAILTKNYLQPYHCRGTNWAAASNCINTKIEINLEIIKSLKFRSNFYKKVQVFFVNNAYFQLSLSVA